MKGVSIFAPVVFLFSDFGLNSVMGQAKEPAPVFRPALEQIRSQTRIPIFAALQLAISHPRDIKLASGTVSEWILHIALLH
jgi:hypothetical protein